MSLMGDFVLACLIAATYYACLKALRPGGFGCRFFLSELITAFAVISVIVLLNMKSNSSYQSGFMTSYLTTYGWPLPEAWAVFKEPQETVLSFSEGRFVFGKIAVLVRTCLINLILCCMFVMMVVALVERVLQRRIRKNTDSQGQESQGQSQ